MCIIVGLQKEKKMCIIVWKSQLFDVYLAWHSTQFTQPRLFYLCDHRLVKQMETGNSESNVHHISVCQVNCLNMS